ncbi:MAG: GH36-type glycosyl hydrolase domain-containing protein, partial [Candidatus Promineifilaceae bacterium]
MRFGTFDDEKREYVITRPDTPLPWVNYLGSEAYLGIISNTAGGYSFYRDARLRRISRYRYNNVPTDFGGRYIYIRDNESSKYWSPSWQPTKGEVESYSCRHGMGYTIIGSSSQGIDSSTRYFVPLEENLEIWELTLTNKREEAAHLSVFSCVEFALWDAYDDMTNFQRNLNIGEVEVQSGVIYHISEYRERRDHYAYFACSEDPDGFDTQRESFLGAYRGWDQPQVVEEGRSRNSIAHGWSPIGSHNIKLDLDPGERRQIIFVLGYHENEPNSKFETGHPGRVNKNGVEPVLEKYLQLNEVDEAFQNLRSYWSELLSRFEVHTPDEHTNRMVNIWNPYQCMVTFNLSRSASSFESGVGRGLGFRDSNQDLLGFVHMVPDRARERILDLAATQIETGGAYHQYQPLTKRGNENVGGDFNDDPLWLVMSTAAYIKETGDWDILEELIPYDGKPGTDSPLFEHLKRSIRYTLERLGPHGLPLIGRADWNDCLNLNTFSEKPGESFQTSTSKDGKVAESLFIAGQFVAAAAEMVEISKRLGLEGFAEEISLARAAMIRNIDDHGWDGEWFLRAYDDFGEKVGSKSCDEGQIFIESQGMNIMAGIGLDDGRAKQALKSVEDRLATEHGIVLHQPAYTRYYLNLGEISSYPPGYKE